MFYKCALGRGMRQQFDWFLEQLIYWFSYPDDFSIPILAYLKERRCSISAGSFASSVLLQGNEVERDGDDGR